MKKILLIISIALLSYSTGQSKVNIGIIGGLNIASLKIEPEDDFDIKSSNQLAIGLYTYIQLNENFGFQITPMFITKGADTRVDINFVGLC